MVGVGGGFAAMPCKAWALNLGGIGGGGVVKLWGICFWRDDIDATTLYVIVIVFLRR